VLDVWNAQWSLKNTANFRHCVPAKNIKSVIICLRYGPEVAR